MRKLTFDSIMEFFKPHNRSVYNKILEAQQNGTLSPFVGAGLSIPFGYKQWSLVLKELAENILDENKKALVLDLIKKGQYEDAAVTTLDEYPFMLDQLPDIVSPDILAKCPDDKKRTSAAWVLPYLFRRELVMTTNFDRVLEECYQTNQNTAIPTVTPANQDRLAQLQLNQELCLLKLHGDIGKEAVSINDLVFTGKQYAQHYSDGTPLVTVLTQRFSTRRMLFLGCSLSVDRTMDILKKVVTAKKGVRHFAILGCKKSEIPTRMKELQALGIIPIFYDDSNHDAVRVILERLLEETDLAGYTQLCRSCRSAPPGEEEKRPLMFDSEYFPFSGREKELAHLAEFCETEDRILWWAVTGPGGMGKSRLVFEFCKIMRKQGWQIHRFEANPSRGSEARRLEELPGWLPGAEKTIVVLDDVQAYMESVCSWMTRMDRIPRSEVLRILLLEREGTTVQDSSWMGPDFKNSYLDEWCHSEGFLYLKPMTDEQLMSVMINYAKAAGKTLNAELLLKTLERVDPQFKRPLYAVAIADARCQGKDPTNWDRNTILDTLLKRELKFHQDRLQGIDGRRPGKAACTELELLLAESCIRGFLPLDYVDWSTYRFLSKRMEDTELEAEDFCKHLGILQTADVEKRRVDQYGHPIDDCIIKEEAKIIILSCPDLLKEHLVLKLAFEKKTLELLPEGWYLYPDRLCFLRRLWSNYPDRLKDQTTFWDRFFSAPSVAGLPALLYGYLLWGCTDVFPHLSQRAVETLAGLYSADSREKEIVICYANGLFNLSTKQSILEQTTTVDQLESLYKAHPDQQEVAVRYANSLFNLVCEQSPEDAANTMRRLEALYHFHTNSPEIACEYAKSLYNLSHKYSFTDIDNIIPQLQTIYSLHTDCVDIAAAYALSLYHAIHLKFTCNSTDSPQRLKEQYDIHPEWHEQLTTTLQELALLYDTHSESERITVVYSATLIPASYFQKTESDVRNTLSLSNMILNKHLDIPDVRLSHAQIWFNLTLVQAEADIPATVTDIATFLQVHSDAIPGFREALDKYLSEYPEHTDRYRPLLELGGDSHA